jgi:ABC-2 type transport system permease protein
VLIASRVLTSAILAIVLVIVIVAIGRIVYGVRVPGTTLPALLLDVVVGAACFCCLAFAAASFIRTEDAAQPIIQAITLPLYFISGVFVPRDQLSGTLRDIASVFPVSHLNGALFKAFDPATTGAGIAGGDLLIVAAWGLAGLALAVWRFSWSPLSA